MGVKKIVCLGGGSLYFRRLLPDLCWMNYSLLQRIYSHSFLDNFRSRNENQERIAIDKTEKEVGK